MCTGRCAGCGRTGNPGKMRDHTMGCPEFAQLYQRDPGSIGTVEQEYEKWLVAGKPEAKKAAHEASVADTDRRRTAMAARFESRDILED